MNQSTATPLTAEEVVTQLRALQEQIPDIAPLTTPERKILREQARVDESVVQASITLISASDKVQQAVGQEAIDLRVLVEERLRWGAVENELKAMLIGVADANLVRRQRAGVTAARAYAIGLQLGRDPENAELRPHLEEVKRLRKLTSRRKRNQPPTPTPAPAPTPRSRAS